MVPSQGHLPFAVVGSMDEIQVGNKMVKARQYPWGIVQGKWINGDRKRMCTLVCSVQRHPKCLIRTEI